MLNVIVMVGRLTRDPIFRATESGRRVGSFTIACDTGTKDENGKSQSLFMDCTIFGPQADFLEKYFAKGSYIGVYGKLTSRRYLDHQNIQRVAYSIICDRIEFVGPASANRTQENAAGFTPDMPVAADPVPQTNPAAETNNLDGLDATIEDLPF